VAADYEDACALRVHGRSGYKRVSPADATNGSAAPP
jgi:hypothetical protein